MALRTATIDALDTALAREAALVEADERAAAGAVGLWNDYVGGGTARAAVAAAAQERSLHEDHKRRWAAIKASGDAVGASALLADLSRTMADATVRQVAAELGAGAGVARIATDAAKDVAAVAVSTGNGWITLIKATPLLALAVAAWMLWPLLSTKRRAVAARAD